MLEVRSEKLKAINTQHQAPSLNEKTIETKKIFHYQPNAYLKTLPLFQKTVLGFRHATNGQH